MASASGDRDEEGRVRNVLREQLPNRRGCDLLDFECGGMEYTAGYTRFEDGRLAEVFLNSEKIGTATETNARDASIILSVALQHGANLDNIRRALTRDPDGKAVGPIGMLLDILEAEKA